MWRDAESLARILHSDPLLFDARRTAAPRIEQPHTRPHELIEVLVARHDHDIHSGVDALPRKCSDDIVRFVPLECEHANIECRK